MRIANLPWYDFDELRGATDAFWRGVARHLEVAGVDAVPTRLDRDTDHQAQWRDPNLLLSQACGYDVLYDSADDLAVVATPRFALSGCEGATYRSVVVVRSSDRARTIADLCGRRCVINEACSHSGPNALRPLVAGHSEAGRFFGEVLASGDHATSLEMVADRRADAACVDLVVWEICRRVRPESVASLRVLARTAPAPAPPYVTSKQTTPELLRALRRALAAAMADRDLAAARAALLIDGVAELPDTAYTVLQDFERPALARHYFELPAPRRSPLSRHAAATTTAPCARRWPA